MEPPSTSLRERFDQIRAAHPDVGIGLYALDPGGPVTLEIITPDGTIFTFTGETAETAMERAFPTDKTPAPPDIFS